MGADHGCGKLETCLMEPVLDGCQQIVDCLVAVGRDADRLAGLEKSKDQVRGRVGLTSARWTLDNKPGAVERKHSLVGSVK